MMLMADGSRVRCFCLFFHSIALTGRAQPSQVHASEVHTVQVRLLQIY